MRATALLAMVSLLTLTFSGCTQKDCPPQKEYVKQSVPRLTILYEVAPAQIKDFAPLDGSYYSVNKEELRLASVTTNKLRKNIKFYERQNTRFNKEFSGSE